MKLVILNSEMVKLVRLVKLLKLSIIKTVGTSDPIDPNEPNETTWRMCSQTRCRISGSTPTLEMVIFFAIAIIIVIVLKTQ